MATKQIEGMTEWLRQRDWLAAHGLTRKEFQSLPPDRQRALQAEYETEQSAKRR